MGLERLIGYGLQKALDDLAICSDYIDCVIECIKNGGDKATCLDVCDEKIIEENDLPLDADPYDLCTGIYWKALGIDFEKTLEEQIKKVIK
ncbi:hypothetical protein J7L13_01660 [bacterium]|nr:hypothetical protein [bacterium]